MADSTDTLFDALERIAATPGKKDKLAIAKTLGGFKDWLRLALDPGISYYVGKLPAYEKHGTSTLEESDKDLLHKLASRELSGNEALDQIRFTMYELTPASQQVLRRVILKDLRCGLGVTMLNEAFPGTIRVFPYQRCTLPKDSNEGNAGWWEGGVVVQLKADGMFANVDHIYGEGVTIYSRQGTPFPRGSLGPLEAALEGALRFGTQTHGELTVYEDDKLLERQIGNGILNSVAQGGALAPNQTVRFDAWDQIPVSAAVAKGKHEVPYSTRLTGLISQLVGADRRYVQIIESQLVYSKADAMKICRAYQQKKLEGVIAKAEDAIWKDGDNKDQVKLKLEVTVDLKIKGFRPGEAGKRTEATFGAVLCATADDKLEVGVHGFTRDMEKYLHENRDKVVGDIMAVTANGVMAPTGEQTVYSLFLPRFTELRLDKTEADTLEQVQAQFEGAVA